MSRIIRDRLLCLAYRFLWNRDEAEDAVQEALVTAHARASDLRDDDKWWPWICKIVVHQCYRQGREKRRRQQHERTGEVPADAVISEPGGEAPSSARQAIRRLLPELPRRQREVVILRHLQGMSYEQIADVLEISSATARVHARAAREALRTRMLAQYPDWFDESTIHENRRT